MDSFSHARSKVVSALVGFIALYVNNYSFIIEQLLTTVELEFPVAIKRGCPYVHLFISRSKRLLSSRNLIDAHNHYNLSFKIRISLYIVRSRLIKNSHLLQPRAGILDLIETKLKFRSIVLATKAALEVSKQLRR